MADQQSLHKTTIDLITGINAVEGTGPSVREISIATNLKEAWINAFKQGKIREPSVDKVQILYEYLTKTELSI
jgi:hypothetical protein